MAVLLLCQYGPWLGVWYCWTHWCFFDDYPADHGALLIVMCEKKGVFRGTLYCTIINKKLHFLFVQVFYWTHNLFIPWYILLILHGTHFWKWFLVPALVYIIERIIRSKWVELARYGRFYITAASNLPSKVNNGKECMPINTYVHNNYETNPHSTVYVYCIIQVIFLGLTRPKRFNYQPGDYIFLNIPSIAKYEWHPFTLSSSPEQDFIGLHIRAVGTWTNKLYEFVDQLTRVQKRDIEVAERKLELKTPGIDVTKEKAKEGEQEIAITLDTNAETLNHSGNHRKDLEVR